MIEKDNIKELFSRSLENHTVPVRPEVWNGLQAKMAAAGISSAGAGGAAKGLSALTKWLIGSAAVTGTAVITTVAILNSSEDKPKRQSPAKTETISETPAPQERLQTAAAQTEAPVAQELSRPYDQNRVSAEADPETPLLENHSYPVLEQPVRQITPQRERVSPETATTTGKENPPVETPQIIEQPETHTQQAAENPGEPAYEKAKIEFPNVFTPNADGDNDDYTFRSCEHVKSVNVRIISSADNSTVFTSTDKDFKWNGVSQRTGEPAPKGLYACSVTYEDLAGKTKTVHFIFELIR